MSARAEARIPGWMARAHQIVGPQRWIVSPGYDLAFFIGSCVVSILFLGLYLWANAYGWAPGGDSVLMTYFIFNALLDHPHIFQTFSRTHYDSEEFARRRGLYTWGLGALIVLGWVLVWAGLKTHLIVFAAFYGSWHIVRQHSGFLKAYKGLNRDTERVDDILDGGIFYAGLLAFILHDYVDLHGPVVIYEGLSAPFPSVPGWLSQSAWAIFWVFAGAFVLRQLQRLLRGQGLNVPKLLLLSAILSTRFLLFWFFTTPFLVAEALETAYHNVQYHGWMNHYQKRRYQHARVAATWLVLALVYGGIVALIETLNLLHPNSFWDYLFAPFAMLILFHYYIDGKVWRFRDYPKLREQMFS